MKVKKYSVIISFLLVLIFGLPPLWLPKDSLVSAYLLAIFGSCVLSLFICIVEYVTHRRENLRTIAMGDFSLEYTVKYLAYITAANKGTGKITIGREEIIELCETAMSACENEFEKIDVCIKGLFLLDWKWKKLLEQYYKKLKENIYDKYAAVQIFVLRNQNEFVDVEQELYKYMFDLAKYNDYENELTTIRKWAFSKKVYKSKFVLQKEPNDMVQDFKKELKERYANK